MKKEGIYTQAEYAEIKQVSRAYINKLVKSDKLIMVSDEKTKKWFIVDCVHNDNLFKKK